MVPVARADPEVVVAVDTPDLGRAVRFYRDALKCEVLEDRSPEFVMVALGPGTGLCIDAAPAGAAPLPAPRLILRWTTSPPASGTWRPAASPCTGGARTGCARGSRWSIPTAAR